MIYRFYYKMLKTHSKNDFLLEIKLTITEYDASLLSKLILSSQNLKKHVKTELIKPEN